MKVENMMLVNLTHREAKAVIAALEALAAYGEARSAEEAEMCESVITKLRSQL